MMITIALPVYLLLYVALALNTNDHHDPHHHQQKQTFTIFATFFLSINPFADIRTKKRLLTIASEN
jgi:hypothetical protein